MWCMCVSFVEMFCCQWQPLGQLVVIVVVYVGSFSEEYIYCGESTCISEKSHLEL